MNKLCCLIARTFFIWVALCNYVAVAQKENYVWYFGDSAGVDFNSGVPVALTNSGMYQNEGCSSISDANGNILFYTNGVKVWNKNHSQMPNGDSLGGHQSSTQSALIVPKPGNNLLYYIFTLGGQPGPNHSFNFSIIDMSLNNGNGDVTVKNNVIETQMAEKLTAVRHSNNSDVWVMVHGWGDNNFYCYLVSAMGISISPVISSIGPVIPIFSSDYIGQMKFSPDGSKIAYAAGQTNYVDLFDFNSTTGNVTNEKYLALPINSSGAYGVEFSANGNYLYSSLWWTLNIFQWDITSNDSLIIYTTRQQIGISSSNYLGSLQLAPDGKIYSAENSTTKLGAINNPNLPGILCNYVDSAVSLDGRMCINGLPNFIASYFLPTGININNAKNQLSIFPNPFSNKLNVTSKTNELAEFVLYDVTGRKIFHQLFTNSTSINTEQLANGIYLYEVRNKNGAIKKGKVVKD